MLPIILILFFLTIGLIAMVIELLVSPERIRKSLLKARVLGRKSLRIFKKND